jgi:hypothetical protein
VVWGKTRVPFSYPCLPVLQVPICLRQQDHVVEHDHLLLPPCFPP